MAAGQKIPQEKTKAMIKAFVLYQMEINVWTNATFYGMLYS